MTGFTLYEKLWLSHLVQSKYGIALLYIDRHLLHEVTSPQAFDKLRLSGRKYCRPATNLATVDHNVPTDLNERRGISDDDSRIQVQTLSNNCCEYDIFWFSINDIRQGIVHVVGPEHGFTLPGMTIVCGDSHTSTHGAFSALSHGIGTSEVSHVLTTQCLLQRKSKKMLVRIDGHVSTAKDIVLAVINIIGTAGGTGYAVELSGSVIFALSMEGRMTICNMAIEAGARVGLIALDKITLNYLKICKFAPIGDYWKVAISLWLNLLSSTDAEFYKILELDASLIAPQVTWGTIPEMVAPVYGCLPYHDDTILLAICYMGLEKTQKLIDIAIDRVFIGSCTNSRIEDLRDAASIAKGRKVAYNIKQALIVPGSGLVKYQAEQEKLDNIFISAGFEWRFPGCSMCLAMNADKLCAVEHCASTSNRNFEGRQGYCGCTHLVSPAMAAAAAIAGHFNG